MLNLCSARPFNLDKSCSTLHQTTKMSTRPNRKHFADDNLNVAQMMEFVFDRVENIVGKGENPSYQHFLLLPQCFQKASST